MTRKYKYSCIVDAIKSRAQASWNKFLTSEDGFFVSFPTTLFSSGQTISSIQQITIALTTSSTNTATISAVNLNSTIIIPQGGTNIATAAGWGGNLANLSLTDSTTVTATSGASAPHMTLNAVVVQFQTGVHSVQAGTIALVNNTSETATISSVGAYAFVIFTGCYATNTNFYYANCIGSVALTNSTTVTASMGDTVPQITVGYMVADMASSLVNGVQAVTHTFLFNDPASATDTITSVTPGYCLIIYGGVTSNGSTYCPSVMSRIDLTDSTTVTITRTLDGFPTEATVVVYYTVVQFASSVLNGSVQRGDITLSSATSGTATIASVNTAKAFANYVGQTSTSGGADAGNVNQMSLTLTNSTTVTADVNSAGSPSISYEVIQFM